MMVSRTYLVGGEIWLHGEHAAYSLFLALCGPLFVSFTTS